MEKYNTEKFIEKARKIHGDKYDYSKVDYVNNRTKVCIICPEHGKFWQVPKYHIDGCGCPQCYKDVRGIIRRKPQNVFINTSKDLHNNKYVYTKVDYKTANDKVCIICPEHGEFWQTPHNHLRGQGCPKCGDFNKGYIKRRNTDDFINKATTKHGCKYDYSKVDYVNNRTKVCIICPEHGEFWQVPYSHLKGFGCSKCGGKFKTDKDVFIKKAQKVHNNKYCYDFVKYENTDTKVTVLCPEHGEFLITPHHHLKGVGCAKCAGNYSYSNEEIINMFKQIHGDEYDYSNVKYLNTIEKVEIICKKHGTFKQSPKAHLKGQGCPICKKDYNKSETKIYEKIKQVFKDAVRSYKPIFLKTYKNGRQELDIFIPSINTAIEYQGKQHFEPVLIFGGEEGFLRTKKLDEKKYKKCKENSVKLFYFSYEKVIPLSYIDKIYTDEEELIKEIKNVQHK